MGVGEGLERGESLRRDDEERLGSVKVACSLSKVRGIDVRHEAQRQVALAVEAQGLVSHYRPQVRSAYADIDDVTDRPTGMPSPSAATDRLGECGHAVKHVVHFGDHIDAIERECRFRWRAQRYVQDRALFGGVDRITAKHRCRTLAQPAFRSQSTQQTQGLVGDTVLRVVEGQPGCLEHETVATRRISGEEIAQMSTTYALVMDGEGLPRRRICQYRDRPCRRYHRTKRRHQSGLCSRLVDIDDCTVEPPLRFAVNCW